MYRAVLSLALCLSCGGVRLLEQSCEGPGGGDSGDCIRGLVCEVQDVCVGESSSCPGTCQKPCRSDEDCPNGRKCGPYGFTPENGSGAMCVPHS